MSEQEWLRLARKVRYKATELAMVAGISLRTLERHFRSQHGVTVSNWLKTMRMREAARRVCAGDRVKNVALDLGYKQLSHFSREFKRTYGAPPTRIASARAKQVPEGLAQRNMRKNPAKKF